LDKSIYKTAFSGTVSSFLLTKLPAITEISRNIRKKKANIANRTAKNILKKLFNVKILYPVKIWIFDPNEKSNTMNLVYLLIGGNLGHREWHLTKAKQQITALCGEIITHSTIYETAAWGNTDQPLFLNQVILIKTLLSPVDLLQQVLQIELDAGRERTEKYGPRTIDIDILFYGNMVIALPELDIPHPRIAERRFVLVPMVEIAADFLHPILQQKMSTLLENCTDSLLVHKKTYSI
jgi:2-amino-4-hydroxy-6-hydroxymethyldihydropteridine diphosphokinase